MANTKSAQKNIRKSNARMLHNRTIKSNVRTLGKKAKATAASGGDTETLKKEITAYISALDKAAKRGILHRNRANRQKAACAKLLVPHKS